MTKILNNRRTREFPKIVLKQAGVGLIMISLALTILFFAQGYRFNWKNFKIIKTGVVYLISNPKQADVYVDNKLRSEKTPYGANLLAGYHNAAIKKEGYLPWSVSYKVESGLVNEYKSIVLIKDPIEITELTDQRKIDLLNSPTDVLARRQDLSYSDYELWFKGEIVARFSEKINKAVLYTDEEHILFQQGDEIRLIELKGSNDTLLVTLSTEDTASFTTNSKGDELYFTDNGYKVARIR